MSRGLSQGPDIDSTLNLSAFKQPSENEISLVSVTVPVVGRSSLGALRKNDSPQKNTRPVLVNANRSFDDTASNGRSTTTAGGGLANKIGACISRILT
jgi:hypothetical protein